MIDYETYRKFAIVAVATVFLICGVIKCLPISTENQENLVATVVGIAIYPAAVIFFLSLIIKFLEWWLT